MVSLVRKLNLIVWSNALCILTVSIIIFLIFHLFVQMNNDDQQNPFFSHIIVMYENGTINPWVVVVVKSETKNWKIMRC